MLTGKPFDDILNVINEQPGESNRASCAVSDAVKKAGLAGNRGLGGLYSWLFNCQLNGDVSVSEAHICIFASSYAVGDDPTEVIQFIGAASKGRAPVNRLCVDQGIGLRVLEMAPEVPHQAGAGWSELDCTKAVAFGMEAAAAGGNLLGLSAMAPGNEAGILALISACTGGTEWLEAEGVDEGTVVNNVKEILANHAEDIDQPLHALRVLGGREVAGCLGALIAAKSRNLPVVIDGWASLAAVSVLKRICKGGAWHVRWGAAENVLQAAAAKKMQLNPIVGTHVDSGPGCGAAVSVSILKAVTDVVG